MNKMEELINMAKISDFMHRQELEDEKKKTVCLVFAIIAGIAAIAVIAYGLYKYLSKEDDMDVFEDDFEDDFDEDFEEDDEEDDFVKEDEAAPAAKADDTEE